MNYCYSLTTSDLKTNLYHSYFVIGKDIMYNIWYYLQFWVILESCNVLPMDEGYTEHKFHVLKFCFKALKWSIKVKLHILKSSQCHHQKQYCFGEIICTKYLIITGKKRWISSVITASKMVLFWRLLDVTTNLEENRHSEEIASWTFLLGLLMISKYYFTGDWLKA